MTSLYQSVTTTENKMTMSDCLKESSPIESLMMLSSTCEAQAIHYARELLEKTSTSSDSSKKNSWKNENIPKSFLNEMIYYKNKQIQESEEDDKKYVNKLPLSSIPQTTNITTSIACAESISTSLSKIALGGSRASKEMRGLEKQRLDINVQINNTEQALKLRSLATLSTQALNVHRYEDAAKQIKMYKEMKFEGISDETLDLAGRSTTITQLDRNEGVVQDAVLHLYEEAVKEGNVAKLSHYTPLLGILSLAEKGVGLYLRYVQKIITDSLNNTNRNTEAVQQEGKVNEAVVNNNDNTCKKLANIFNVGVMVLRHHLPMVASALGDADGDAALVQLVHLEVEKRSVQLLSEYSTFHSLKDKDEKASNVISRMEEKYVHGNGLEHENLDLILFKQNDMESDKNKNLDVVDDCGFTNALGSLSSLDSSLDEVALILQHTESYERFIRHAVAEVNNARELRKKVKEQRLIRQKQSDDKEEEEGTPTSTLEILPKMTLLNDVVAEFGGHYSGLEHVLLMGSIQRALISQNKKHEYHDDHDLFTLVVLQSSDNQGGEAVGCKALQTSLVEECFYAAQRSTIRAFATGHSGTASAAANFCADVIGRTLLQAFIRKANASTTALKSLLVSGFGSLLSQATAMAVKKNMRVMSGATSSTSHENESMEKYRVDMAISKACAYFNDLEVAMEYTKRLETQFLTEIQTSYPPNDPNTEQLRTCIKQLGPVIESYKTASIRNMEQFGTIILPKVRAIVNEAVGLDAGSAGSGFMGAVVGGSGVTSTPVSQIRMNYDLDDEGYELAQVTEGYMSRLCTSLEELIQPLRIYLMPQLSDILMIEVIGAAAKRLESALRRIHFSIVGAISFDADIRYFVSYAKKCLTNAQYASNISLYKSCMPLARLSQIALLMNVDDLDDVLDLIATSKRKSNWDLKIEDAKAFLNLRVDFEGKKVNELLRISEEEG